MDTNTLYWIAVAAAFHRSKVDGPESSNAWRPFDDLVRERLLRYTRRVLRRLPNDDEDAVQDSLIRLRDYAAGAPADAELFRRWFFRIARTVCLNLLRNPRGRTKSLEGKDCPAPSAGPSTQIMQRESDEQLRELVGTLPARQAEVLKLHYLEERSVKTIARRLGDETRQVRKYIAAGRASMKDKLIAAGLAPAA